MKTSDLEKMIRESIKEALKSVNNINAPKINTLIQSTEGYKNVEEKIIELMVVHDLSAAQTLIHLENSL